MSKSRISIVVGSTNPVKVGAAKAAFERMFADAIITCEGVKAPSGVPDQPMTAEQTREGAVNRAEFCLENYPQHDYYLSMEGGVDMFDHGPAAFAYIAIKSRHRTSVVRGASLPLPICVFEALSAGEELGDVMDRMFNTENIKQKGGAIGLLTNHLVTRQSNYEQAILLGLAPFLHADLYNE